MASDATTASILDTAERLFAANGFDGTSVREITREAGVNVAAVHYHFGDKSAVLRAVTDRIVGPMNERRLRMLELAEAAAGDGSPPDLAAVVEAFIRPDFETLQELQGRGPTVARFLGRLYSDGSEWVQEMAAAQFGPVGARFACVFAAIRPDLTADEVDWRFRQVANLLIAAFAAWPTDGRSADEAEREARRLIDFAVAGLAVPSGARAPSTGTTRSRKGAH